MLCNLTGSPPILFMNGLAVLLGQAESQKASWSSAMSTCFKYTELYCYSVYFKHVLSTWSPNSKSWSLLNWRLQWCIWTCWRLIPVSGCLGEGHWHIEEIEVIVIVYTLVLTDPIMFSILDYCTCTFFLMFVVRVYVLKLVVVQE